LGEDYTADPIDLRLGMDVGNRSECAHRARV